MTPQQWIGLAVRLFSVWVFLDGMPFCLTLVSTGEPNMVVAYLMLFLFLSIPIALWCFPMFVARKLLPLDESDKILRLPSHARGVVVVACITLGLWVFTFHALSGIPVLVMGFVSTFSLFNTPQFIITNLASIGISLVISAVLCLKAHPIARYLTTEPGAAKED